MPNAGPLDGFEKRDLCPDTWPVIRDIRVRGLGQHHGSYKCSDGAEEKHADLLTFLEKARSAQKPVAYITTGTCAT